MANLLGASAPQNSDVVLDGEDMYRLGLQASTGGDEGEFDLITAHKWFNLAAMQGNQEARIYRAELANEMTTEEIAEAQRQAREYLSVYRAKKATATH